MRYARILNYDTANGPGLRTSLFVQGCPHHCKGCFNPETWSFTKGLSFDEKVKNSFIDSSRKVGIRGVSILGGEPLAQGEDMLELLKELRIKLPDKDIWMWTGYTYEKLNELQKEIISYVDVLVDGRFIEEQKDIRLVNRGSSNQRIIDVKQSLEKDEIVLWSEDNNG